MNDGLDRLSAGAVGRSSLIVGAGFASAQVLGLVRALWLAANVGLSGELDALLVALGLTTLAAGLLTTGASGALVPLYLEARHRNGREDARRLSGSLITWLALGGLVISLLIALLAPILITLSGPGLRPQDHDRATVFLQFLTPVMFLTVVTSMLRVVCQAEDRFGSIALATVAGPATTVATMLALWEPLKIDGLVLGSVVGAAATLGVYVWATARAAALPIPRLTTDPRLRSLARHAIPVSVSGGILQFRGIADNAIATLLGPGSVSALRYAVVLITPLTQIGASWSDVIYPRLVRLTIGAQTGSLALWVERTLRSVVAISLPIAVLTMAVAPVAVYVAYGRGAFGPEDLRLTAETLAAYAPIVVALMMLPVLVGSLNARRRGGTLLLGGTLNVALNVGLDLALAPWLGAPGIALASSVTEIVVVAVFVHAMVRSADTFHVWPLVRTIGLATIAIGPFAFVIATLSWTGVASTNTLGALGALAAFGIVGVVGYLLVAARLGVETAQDIIAGALARFDRPRPAAPHS